MLFWNAGIMGRKEQLLEAIFWINEEQQRGDCHVATSPRRDVATSRRQLENLHLIIKCQRARKLGYGEADDQRQRLVESEDPDFERFPGSRIVFHFCLILLRIL